MSTTINESLVHAIATSYALGFASAVFAGAAAAVLGYLLGWSLKALVRMV